jgi:hypothetical protein
MLKVPAEFPFAGSFALYVDTELPVAQQRAELVRVIRWGELSAGGSLPADEGVVGFPLRSGASGTRYLRRGDLIDGTPLTRAEELELADLEGHLRGRDRLTPKMMRQQERATALKRRLVFSQVLAAEIRKLERLDARDAPSTGTRLPREIAA